jgi:hypothetical protein
MGTVQATSIPYVFLASNQERRLGDALRRRSFYLVVEHPTAEREAAIVAKRSPHASEKTHRFIAGLAKSLRAYTMEKPPSISEMNDVALAMQLLGIEQIKPDHKDIMLPLIAKTEGDRKRLLMKQTFESIVRIAGRYASEISPAEEPDLDAIFAKRAEVTASQLFQCAQAVLSVIDRLKMVTAQELSQLVRIDSITFTTVFQQGILARITHHDFADARLQQVV